MSAGNYNTTAAPRGFLTLIPWRGYDDYIFNPRWNSRLGSDDEGLREGKLPFRVVAFSGGPQRAWSIATHWQKAGVADPLPPSPSLARIQKRIRKKMGLLRPAFFLLCSQPPP